MLPLVEQKTEYFSVGDLRDLYLEEDQNYDTLVMATRSPHVTIIPQGLVYITKERAQDRAIPSAHLVQTQKACPAFCVQSSQCGLMQRDKTEHREFRLLPAGVRQLALAKRNAGSISTLWDDLATFNQQLNVPGNFLVSFFQRYQQQLSEFVAEFEVVPSQRGAIILINGEVVGVEVMPNSAAFAAIWEPLIRDCYGAEALLQAKDSRVPAPVLMEDVETLDDLLAAVEDLAQRERVWAESVVETAFSQNQQLREEEREGEFQLQTIETAEFDGQLVQRGRDTLYLSLLRKRGNAKSQK